MRIEIRYAALVAVVNASNFLSRRRIYSRQMTTNSAIYDGKD
jgi:hypothetical protein